MTPQEKAKELYEKFSLYTRMGDEEDIFGEYNKANKYFNKNACLLCVQEILKAGPSEYSAFERTSTELYWEEVEKELNKL